MECQRDKPQERLFLFLSACRQVDHRKRLRGSGREELLLFALRDIRFQILLASPQRSHEAHAAAFGHCADPAFLMNIAPSGKMQHCAGFHVPVCRKKEQLYPFFAKPDLGDTTRLLIIENTATNCAKIGEFGWNVVMFEPVFHKKQITQSTRFGAYRIEHHRSSGSSHSK